MVINHSLYIITYLPGSVQRLPSKPSLQLQILLSKQTPLSQGGSQTTACVSNDIVHDIVMDDFIILNTLARPCLESNTKIPIATVFKVKYTHTMVPGTLTYQAQTSP